jgi:hypothetical protein
MVRNVTKLCNIAIRLRPSSSSRRFRDKSLGLALGLNLSCARLATALNDILSPWIAGKHNSPVEASWVGTGFCLLSLLCAVCLGLLTERRIHTDYHLLPPRDLRDDMSIHSDETVQLHRDDDSDSNSSNDVCSNDANTRCATTSVPTTPVVDAEETVHLEHIFRLPSSFWLLCLSVIGLYGSVNPFIHVLSGKFFNPFWLRHLFLNCHYNRSCVISIIIEKGPEISSLTVCHISFYIFVYHF